MPIDQFVSELLFKSNRLVTTVIAYDGNQNAEYIGEASPNTGKGEAKWRIKKLTYDINQNATDIQWAGGTSEDNQVWDNRASLSYS